MKKINKATARKLYKVGKAFWITACNMRPECGLYMQPSWIQSGFGGDFDRMINNFTYYNCDYERGYYPAFYVEEGA